MESPEKCGNRFTQVRPTLEPQLQLKSSFRYGEPGKLPAATKGHALAKVRYIVNDVDEAIAFYQDHFGFEVDMHPAPGFAALSRGDLTLLLNQPGVGGAGKAGGNPEPGGWARFQIEIDDLDALVDQLESAGVGLKGEVVSGQGGKQALALDPSGNIVELFEPA